MPKNVLEDMVKIKTSRKETALEKELDSEVEDKFNSYYSSLTKKEKKKVDRGNNSKNSLWFLALVSALFLFFALSFLFSSATVTVHPRQKDVALSQNYIAVKDASADDSLPFDLTVISGDDTAVIPAGAETDVSTSAKGTVIIYNAFSATSQQLNINTRLEGSNGKIYKTTTQVMVPGMKGTTPGSAEVDVYASDPGDSYNSGPLDFKIFGFKGTPKYIKFYARSKGNIAGGLVGTSSTVSDDQKGQAIAALTDSLKDKLFKRISDQIPAGFVLFKDAVVLNVDDTSIDTTSSKSQATLTLKGTLYGFLFNETKLTKKIMQSSLADYDGSPVHISNIKDLTFNLANKENIDFKNVASIAFTLSGTPRISWDVDMSKLTTEIAGKSKNDFNTILSQYKNIDSATVVIRPVWKFSFPDNQDDIKIVVDTTTP